MEGAPNVEVQGHCLAPNGEYFHRCRVHTGENDVHCLVPREVTAPEMPDDGELPLTKAGEFGAVLLGTGASIPNGPAGLAWEMAFDRMPPASLTFAKPKVWLLQRMRVQKATPRNYYKLARS